MKKYLILIIIIIAIVLIVPFAKAEYELEVSIPDGPQAGEKVSLPEYIRYIYLFILSIVGLAAFGALVFGGFKYMLSAGSIGSAEEAKKWIWGAIFGLILALSAYLILKTINPDLVKIGGPEMPEIQNNSGGANGSC